jgi:CRISPR-associated endonuclease/helicase Cas3
VFVVMLRDCIARPDDEGRRFGLIEHLVAVAERCGRVDGPPEEKLAFLAGLLHDAAKTAQGWQDYIRRKLKEGPPHAPLGAALFAVWSEDLIPRWTADPVQQAYLFDLALDWIRVVYDHHGRLDDLSQLKHPWEETIAGHDVTPLLQTCDLAGLTSLVSCFFPETMLSLIDFPKRFASYCKKWASRMIDGRGDLLDEAIRQGTGKAPLAERGLRLAKLGSRLIFADRSHVADWDETFLDPRTAERGILQLGAYCGRRAEETGLAGANADLVRRRSLLTAAALEVYRRQRDTNLFTLVLPTGCGKTLAGLRIALDACRDGRCRRILYVAPYLSILSQAADEIRRASGLDVFVHHHQSVALLDDHQSYDVLETWQAPILATTFNQLCRALFPSRAQQCLRIPALDETFILVDEPQILDPSVWNLFLKALEEAARLRRCQVLFLTATLPPTNYGFDVEPIDLVSRKEAFSLTLNRYTIRSELGAPWKPATVAEKASERLKSGSVAVILNTVRDAVDVYEKIKTRGQQWFCLTARMLPGHKQGIIRKLRGLLDSKQSGGVTKVGVVASQVIEAGVDLSFTHLLRARPIFSSVVQAAGRANRHGEGVHATVTVFPFLRDDGKDSRPWIYRDEAALQQTDELLHSHPNIPEQDVADALAVYYREWWSRCPREASLEMLSRSARGEWSAVAGLTPFADDLPRTEVFVPRSDRYLTEEGRHLLKGFGFEDSTALLAKAQDRAFRRRLDFLARKRLSALLRQFTVSVPERLAKALAKPLPPPTGLDWLWVLDPEVPYSDETGLALGSADDTDESTIII